jgi:outer membrane lipoprotein SlyB
LYVHHKDSNMKSTNLLAVLLVSGVILGGCAESLSGSAYSRGQAREVMEVRMAVVESVRHVQIEGTRSGVGTAAGAVVGGVAGSNVGAGKGSTVGAVLGAVGGGLLGSALEQGTVKLDSGKLLAITQEADEEFRVGERVRILTGGGVTRVSH